MTGSKIGKLEVLHEGPRLGRMRAYWCRCVCGDEILRRESQLKGGGPNQACVNCKGRKKTLDDSQKKIVENYYKWMIKQVRWNWVRKIGRAHV